MLERYGSKSPVSPVFPTVSYIFSSVSYIFFTVPDIFTAVIDIFDAVQDTPMVPGIADIFTTVPYVFSPVTHIFPAILYIFPVVKTVLDAVIGLTTLRFCGVKTGKSKEEKTSKKKGFYESVSFHIHVLGYKILITKP
jgi:hypothetical protein